MGKHPTSKSMAAPRFCRTLSNVREEILWTDSWRRSFSHHFDAVNRRHGSNGQATEEGLESLKCILLHCHMLGRRTAPSNLAHALQGSMRPCSGVYRGHVASPLSSDARYGGRSALGNQSFSWTLAPYKASVESIMTLCTCRERGCCFMGSCDTLEADSEPAASAPRGGGHPGASVSRSHCGGSSWNRAVAAHQPSRTQLHSEKEVRQTVWVRNVGTLWSLD